ncbi:hypothetical protein MON38_15595 [Hymenobacter sp. DH14]|uniref:Uncharacterized protein n=1 Tax=Hymenobacter cyanobacteriorum TaxID=2926463 RepID=A0A9X1VHE6_9BACT|nr:hypothetical protein [Hymenobacter cyanobacteriorum]MCI1188847.1 hypothetical protein [Hymenobacter cyanobacteriorum]
MKSFLHKIIGGFFLTGLVLGNSSVRAQAHIEGAVQQGKGAYVQKTDRTECITNTLLGVPGIGRCLPMSQEKFMVTPSGSAMSVWKGVVPATARPTQRLVYNATWTEANNDGVTRTYNTVAVTMPDGSVKLTLMDKDNGHGKK